MSAVSTPKIEALPEIAGYRVSRMLGEGATSRVYAVERDGRTFALKLMRNDLKGDLTSFALRFRKEAETLGRMNHPSLVKVLELGEVESIPYVVMELLKGTELSAIINQRSMSEKEVLLIARGIAGALAVVHRNGIIHRDIKPDNIFVDENGNPKLIDFGFAEGQANIAGVSQETVGTLLYSSPEQSGLTKDSVGASSDLYSLGCVLFECAAGRPVFGDLPINELLQKRMAESAPELRSINSSIGPVLSGIVAKLLEREPKNRYQAAEGVLSDLSDIEALTAEFKEKGTLSLGQRDFKIGGQSELPLLGRSTEFDLLKSQLERAKTGSGMGFIIEGEPGSGKSFLIKKFLESVEQNQTLILSGKCQIAEQTPLGPLRETIDTYLRQLHSRGNATFAAAAAQMKTAAASIEVSVRRLSRGLAEILGTEEDSGREQGQTQSQDKFFSDICQFFTALAKIHGHLVLHIDDVQWLDQASLGILSLLQERLKETPVILLTTARNDQASRESLEKVAAQWTGAGTVRRLNLQPLGREAIDGIVQAQLGGKSLAPSVIDRLAAKANGNPFAISQFIYAMVDARILQRSAGEWTVDESRLDKLIVSADVVELILSRIGSLSAEARKALRVAAAIGNKFEESVLREIVGADIGALSEAVRANLIEVGGQGRYSFVHDRILEALLRDLPSEELSALHQRIAETLDRGGGPTDIYALASHYSQGQWSKNPRRSYQVIFEAGRLSMENFAIDDAIDFLEVAKEISQGPLASEPPKDLESLHESLGVGYFRKGFPKKAIEHCEQVLRMTNEQLVAARTRAVLTNVYLNENQGKEGWRESELGLASLGTRFPKSKIMAAIYTAAWWVIYYLANKLNIGYGRASGEEVKQRRVALSLYGPSTLASFVGLRYELTEQLMPRMLYQLHRMGNRLESVPGIAFHALWLGVHQDREGSVARAKQAMEIAERFSDNILLGHARFFSGFGIHWSGQPQLAEKFQKETLLSYGRWLPPRWYISTANDLTGNNLLVRGLAREALTIADLNQKRAAATKTLSSIAVGQSLALGVYAILGNEHEVERSLKELQETYAKIPPTSLDWCWNIAHVTLTYLERNQNVPNLDQLIEHYSSLKVNPRWAPLFYKTAYLYLAYASMRAYITADQAEISRAKARFQKCFQNFKLAASNMPHWLCHGEIMNAEIAIFEGRPAEAERFLQKAQAFAEESDSAWGKFQVNRCRAIMARSVKDQDKTIHFAMAAEAIASENSWKLREALIRREFQAEFALRKTRNSAKSETSDATHEALQRQIETLLSVSRVAAQNNGDQKQLISSTLDELVRIFAADRAVLLLYKGDGELQQFGRDSGGQDLPKLADFSSTVVQKVLKDRKSIIVSGTADGAVIGSASVVLQDLRSIMSTPLIYRNKLLGAIYLDSRMSNGLFEKDDVRLLEGVSNQIAVFMEAASTASKMRGLLELSLAAGVMLDPKAQSRIALDECISILGAQRAFLFLSQEGSEELTLSVARDNKKADLTEVKGYSSTILKKAVSEGQPILVTGTEEGELLGSRSAVVNDLRSIMVAPLVSKGKNLGALYLDSQIAKGGFSPEDVKVLVGVSNQIAIALITAQVAKLEIERRELEKDLEVTGTVQNLLLPERNDFISGDISLFGHFQPTARSGGDWWWHQVLPNGNILLIVGDVTGHGPGPAMVTAVVAGIFHSLLNSANSEKLDLGEIGRALNDHFRQICKGTYWMTMAMLEFELNTGRVHFWSAGAPGVLVHRANKTVEEIVVRGAVLGMECAGTPFGHQVIELKKDEVAVILTDGVTEMHCANGNQLGLRRTIKSLIASCEQPNVEQISADFLKRLEGFRGNEVLRDDVTFVVVKRSS